MTCVSCGAVVPTTARHCPNCGALLSGAPTANTMLLTTGATFAGRRPHTLWPPGTLLTGRYRIERVLGVGAFGRVYLATDVQDPGTPQLAIKELAVTDAASLDDKQEAIAWFKREVGTLLALDHPGIPAIHSYWTADRVAGLLYLAMDYIPGKTLEQTRVDAGGRLPWQQVVMWGIALCDVLAYLHAHTPPVVFRDMKPVNVMIDSRTNTPVLIDFGIARQLARTQGTTIGTPGYSPYEQYLGKAEQRRDLYALGAVLHTLLTGRSPEAEYTRLLRTGLDVEGAMRALFPPVDTLVAGVPAALGYVLTRATAFRIDDRYLNALALRTALQQVLTPATATYTYAATVPFLAAAPVPAPGSQRTTASSVQTQQVGAPVGGKKSRVVILALIVLGALGWGVTLAQHGSGSPPPRHAAAPAASITPRPRALAAQRSSRPKHAQRHTHPHSRHLSRHIVVRFTTRPTPTQTQIPTDTTQPTATETPQPTSTVRPRPTATASIRIDRMAMNPAEQRVANAAVRSNTAWTRAVSVVSSSGLTSVKMGVSLSQTLAQVSALRQQNQHWVIYLRHLQVLWVHLFRSDYAQSLVRKDESRSLWNNGAPSPAQTWNTPYLNLIGLRRINGHWLVSTIDSIVLATGHEQVNSDRQGDPVDVVNSFYNAVSQQDYAAAYGLFSDDLKVREPSENSWSEQFNGETDVQVTDAKVVFRDPSTAVVMVRLQSTWTTHAGNETLYSGGAWLLHYEHDKWALDHVVITRTDS